MHSERDALPEPGQVAHEGVSAAWQRALKMKHRKRGDFFVVGIADGEQLLARGSLDSFERLAHFARSMTEIGFVASFDEDDGPQLLLRCDVVFRREDQAASRGNARS